MRAALVSLVLLAGCVGYDDLALLDVDTVEPPEIEPGGTLRIHGNGFPLGHTPEILLRGPVYRPGMPASTVDARLDGLVASEALIEIPIGEELIEALGGRATVDGELRVSFQSADGARAVFAAERVRIDFLPDTSTLLRADGLREAAVEPAAARAFGVELSREELGIAGVRVVAVEPGSLAAKQGVKPEDRLIALDGASIYSWRDFVPDPSKSESTVLVARDGLRGVHALRWPRKATERRVEPALMALFALVGLLLGWLSPSALGLRPLHARAPASAWLARAAFVLLFAALLFGVAALQWVTMWILVLGTFAALFTLAARHRAGASSFAFAVVSALTVMLVARTASISEIVAAQSPLALRWYLFQSPASFLACAVFVHALGSVSAQSRLSASLYSAAAAVLGAALFLGGWPLSGALAGIALLFVKALAVLGVAGTFEMNPKAAVTVTGLGIGLALLGLFIDLGTLFPQWSAVAVGWTCALGARALIPPLRRVAAPAPV